VSATAKRRLGGWLAGLIVVASVPVALVLGTMPPASALANGLALTPPMGWNDWNHFQCGINESVVKKAADAMVSKGLKAVGYQYINIDDCWAKSSRDSHGNLVPDPAKFPDGISGTANYVHSKGLKLGIYLDAGTHTCATAGFPGSLGHEKQDAKTIASWGVDYLKYDNCHNNGVPATQRYPVMRDALAATGRAIVYSICTFGQESPWTFGPADGNLWRTTGDIGDNWNSMTRNLDINAAHASIAKPGAWNDPDMLEIGNGGMSSTEYRSHFSMWAMMAAPLIAGNDLAGMSSTTQSILTNKEIIDIDQDPLGKQGVKVAEPSSGLQVWSKQVQNGVRAVALFNRTGSTANITASFGQLGLSSNTATVRDLWAHADRGTFTGSFTASVPSHGTVVLRVAPAGGPPPPSNAIVSKASGRCLDDPASSTTNGTQLDIWDCTGAVNQRWTVSGKQLQVLGKCLDAFNNQTTPGTKVEIWDCNGGGNQQWNINSNGTVTGVQSGLCLDVTGGKTANGTPVELWTCNGGTNQQWSRS